MKNRAEKVSKKDLRLAERAIAQTEILLEALERIREYDQVSDVWNEDIPAGQKYDSYEAWRSDTPEPKDYYTKTSLRRKRMELVETLREMEKSLKSY